MSRYSVHPMEKKFIKDTTGVDLDAPPPDLVKKFNTQESDEIESLRKEVEYYRKAQQDFYTPNAALKAQVAELEKERDEWKESAINGGNAGYLREKVAELEKERGYDPVAISENTMNKYRNAVIDECIDIAMESNSPVTEMTELKR